jgi:signal transduction histidine kinase
MDLSRVAPALAAPLVLSAIGLLIFYLQIRIHLRSAGFRGPLWGAMIALCAAVYAVGDFVSGTATSLPFARLSTQLQYSSLVLVVLCLAGYTASYLALRQRRVHLAAGTLSIVLVVLIWATDLVATRAVQPASYLLLPGRQIQTTLGILELPLIAAIFAGGVVIMGFWITHRGRMRVSRLVIGAFVFWLAVGLHDGLVTGLDLYVPPLPLLEYGMIGFSFAVLSQSLRDYFATFDLAERRRVELERATVQAEAANRAKTAFLANMSHELRTPLNHVIGFTELVVSRELGALNARQAEYLSDALASGRHLLALINDVLDLSKVEAGKMALALAEVDLGSLLEQSMSVMADKATEKQLMLETRIGTLPRIAADERKLRQVLLNLLSNAVKFTPPGGRVTLAARPTEASGGAPGVEIAVIDTGIGLRAEDLERIFRPFEQVEDSASRSFPGTGLGLSLSRELVRLHGGSIRAQSPGVGAGSTFTFLLPVTPARPGGPC